MAALTLFAAGVASFVFPTAGPLAGVLMLSVAASGFVAVQPLFWTMPTGYLADTAKAGGIALIGTGNLGGFIAPRSRSGPSSTFILPRGAVSAGRHHRFRRRPHRAHQDPRARGNDQAG